MSYESNRGIEAGLTATSVERWVRENLSTQQRRQIAPLWAVATLIAGLLFLRLGANLHSFRHWKSTPGVLQSVHVEQKVSGARRFSTPHLKYSYQVNGKDYQGERLAFVTKTLVSRSRYGYSSSGYSGKVGQPLSVHYNPANPVECVLEGPDSSAYLELIGYLIVAISALVAFFHESRLPDAEPGEPGSP
jgi:hypothetical protein